METKLAKQRHGTLRKDISKINQTSIALLERQNSIQQGLTHTATVLNSKISRIDERIGAIEESFVPTSRTQHCQLIDMTPIDATTFLGAMCSFYSTLHQG